MKIYFQQQRQIVQHIYLFLSLAIIEDCLTKKAGTTKKDHRNYHFIAKMPFHLCIYGFIKRPLPVNGCHSVSSSELLPDESIICLTLFLGVKIVDASDD